MENDLYYKITLINNVNIHKFQYCINLNSCITILKIIERNYNKKICNCRLINCINKIFQNNYNLYDTNSIKVIYDKKIKYKFINKIKKKEN